MSTATPTLPGVIRPEGRVEDFAPAEEVSPVRVRIHDTSRLQWSVGVPLPERGERPYEIDVCLELPANAALFSAPWDQLQTFTRLEGSVRAPPTGNTTIDTLRRAAISLTELLRNARAGFERHCRAAAKGEHADKDAVTFLTIWLDAALRVTHEARAKLVGEVEGDSPLIARERRLIDEFVSVRLLEMLADADRVLRDVESARSLRGAARDAEVESAFHRVRASLNDALAKETAYRDERGYIRAEASSPASLERYVARAARLKKHFEEVLYLDRTTKLVDERVRQWMTILAAFLAGTVYAAMQVAIGFAPSEHMKIGAGLIGLFLLGGVAYVARDRIKEVVKVWLTGRVYRYHAQRVSECRVPERRMAARDVVARSREWCNDTSMTYPDPLNPESGASVATTAVAYVHRGVVFAHEELASTGVHGIRHQFRYDLSPMFSRLHDESARIPVVTRDGRVSIVDAPRRYYVPFRIRVRYDGYSWDERVTLVLDKRGLRRLDGRPVESPYGGSSAL